MDISIVTTVKNDSLGIYPTIKSVINQSIFGDIEYIIVDASTNEKTTKIIAELIKKNKIKYIKSNDNNLYTGIKIGIKASKGKYIGILNAGDIYFSNNVLKDVLKIASNHPSTNLISGNVVYFNSYEITRVWAISIKNLSRIDPFKIPHPACFIKKDILIQNQYYSSNYKISSDLDFFLKSKRDFNMRNIYINKNFIFMREGGLSTNLLKMPIKIFEDLSILFSHYSIFFVFFYLKKIVIKLPGFFFIQKNKYHNILLERLLEISKK
jgi:glycosyltransferase involved in cell wall biosynthesis